MALACCALALGSAPVAHAQDTAARAVLERAAEAMGGRERIEGIDSFLLTGFGQHINQDGGSRPSTHPRAPAKWQVAHGVERWFDLANRRALNSDRRTFLFPFAGRFGHSWDRREALQTGVAMLDHPLPALRAALAPDSRLGSVRVEDGHPVVEFTTADGRTLWLATDPRTDLPAWLRWIAPNATLGDVTHTAYFTGYLPFDGIRLPTGLTQAIDWRDTTTMMFHVDSYRLNPESLPGFPPPSAGFGGAPAAQVNRVADRVWDVRVGGNGGAVIEFADHLVMFEAYGSEAATLTRIDAANQLVPGKQVSRVIVSHHHFDHTGGLRAAVSRGLEVIAHRGNEELFREMIARPAPVFPDALARNPQPLVFVPVDEHLVLEDATMRVDVYHALGHLHMAEAVFAYIPEHRIFIEGDFTTHDWDWHWWGGSYLDSIEHYGLDPVLNIPVHGIVTTFEETVAAIEEQIERARAYCRESEAVGIFPAGCPVRYSRE
jgi:glyoxylase-like metal-dependent hydrolase (beta-lactamase superfamily II)